MSTPRVVYIGTSAFAADILAGLTQAGIVPILVVSRPDRPAGRGRKLTAPPVIDAAKSSNIRTYQPDTINSEQSVATIAAERPDALVVCAYGALVREPLLSDYTILNVHPSMLPRWRGAAPIERAIMAGDPVTGVSIMRLTEGLDSGPVCAQAEVPIEPSDDFGSLSERLTRVGTELLVAALTDLSHGALEQKFVEQDETGVTYAEKVTVEDRRLDLARPAGELVNQVRALSPHVGAFIEQADGARLGVWAAGVENDAFTLLEVQPPGKRRMSAADYARGQR